MTTDGPAYTGPAWPFDIPTPAAQPARTPAAGREHAAAPRGTGRHPGVVRTGRTGAPAPAPATAGAGVADGGAGPVAVVTDAPGNSSAPVAAHGDQRPGGDTATGTGDAAGPARDGQDGGGHQGPPGFPGFPGPLGFPGFPGFPDGGGFRGAGLPALPGMPLDGGRWDHRREWTGDRG